MDVVQIVIFILIGRKQGIECGWIFRIKVKIRFQEGCSEEIIIQWYCLVDVLQILSLLLFFLLLDYRCYCYYCCCWKSNFYIVFELYYLFKILSFGMGNLIC